MPIPPDTSSSTALPAPAAGDHNIQPQSVPTELYCFIRRLSIPFFLALVAGSFYAYSLMNTCFQFYGQADFFQWLCGASTPIIDEKSGLFVYAQNAGWLVFLAMPLLGTIFYYVFYLYVSHLEAAAGNKATIASFQAPNVFKWSSALVLSIALLSWQVSDICNPLRAGHNLANYAATVEAMLHNHQYDRALAVLSAAESTSKDANYCTTVYSYRGLVLKRKGEFKPAIVAYTKAIELANEGYGGADGEDNAGRAQCYIGLHDFDNAIADCNQGFKYAKSESKVVEVEPARYGEVQAELFQARGEAYFRKHDFAKALADFEHATKADPEDGYSLYGSVRCLQQLGNKAAAESALAKMRTAEFDPTDETVAAFAVPYVGR
jgi:tetratricopeptide (TPR) repeat protein